MFKKSQQTACVGLQLPTSTFSFMIPSQLSCIGWNNMKLLDCEVIEGTNANMGGQNLYVVIRNSFIEGLNTLEYLLQAISGVRTNFFSENTAISRTLTRKLMYYLRDLCHYYNQEHSCTKSCPVCFVRISLKL
jgi:DNA-directed RNA polymerase IV subunit 1